MESDDVLHVKGTLDALDARRPNHLLVRMILSIVDLELEDLQMTGQHHG